MVLPECVSQRMSFSATAPPAVCTCEATTADNNISASESASQDQFFFMAIQSHRCSVNIGCCKVGGREKSLRSSAKVQMTIVSSQISLKSRPITWVLVL